MHPLLFYPVTILLHFSTEKGLFSPAKQDTPRQSVHDATRLWWSIPSLRWRRRSFDVGVPGELCALIRAQKTGAEGGCGLTLWRTSVDAVMVMSDPAHAHGSISLESRPQSWAWRLYLPIVSQLDATAAHSVNKQSCPMACWLCAECLPPASLLWTVYFF